MKRKNKLSPKHKHLMEQLGANMLEARKQRAFSAKYVCEQTGISRSTLWNLENGNSTVSLLTVLKVLSLYGLERDLLYLANEE